MSKRNTYVNYIQYLKLKNTTTTCSPTQRSYDQQYNDAITLIDTGIAANIALGVTILEKLLTIKKDPEVLALVQEYKGC